MSKTLLEVSEQMAEAIREWNRAKREREEWKPIPGMVPPAKYLDNARKANVLLTKALEEYEAFQQSFAADGACTCAKVRFYPDENVFDEACPIHGTPRR
jgi:hypothetical protein